MHDLTKPGYDIKVVVEFEPSSSTARSEIYNELNVTFFENVKCE